MRFFKYQWVLFLAVFNSMAGQGQTTIHWQSPKQFKVYFDNDYHCFTHQQLVFLRTPGQILAYHSQNGKLIWHYPAQPRFIKDHSQDLLVSSRQHKDFIYLCQLNDIKPGTRTSKKQSIVKLQALTGKVLWKRSLQAGEIYIPVQQGPPLIKKGKYLSGLNSNNGKTRWKIEADMPYYGRAYQHQQTLYTSFVRFSIDPSIKPKSHLVALDIATGKLKWKTLLKENIGFLFGYYNQRLLVIDKYLVQIYNLQGQKQWSFRSRLEENSIDPSHVVIDSILYYLPSEQGVFFAESLEKEGDRIWVSDVNVKLLINYGTQVCHPLNYKQYLIVKVTDNRKSLVLISKRTGQLVKTVQVPGDGIASRLVTDGKRIFYADYSGTVYSISFP